MREPNYILGPVDRILAESVVSGQFTPETLPNYKDGVARDIVHGLLIEPVLTLALAYTEERTSGYGDYQNITDGQRLVQGVAIALDAIAPLAGTRRDQHFPYTYASWIEAGAGHDYALGRASEPIGWSEWIDTVCREIAVSATPEPHTGTQ